ncbi:hypothetical protein KVR01_001293 [Diaporthe batatas]|uniref:uncharacterized protein n=1 Tax=Diaporthe batatas TaxID=748121 RepID=UPI001D041439|nr:uncharacterized protein KVR01_001293 [Diaporthe batatas]KAG8168544.1 hypothetical protein KVR01_001293 [Diaporthe batatas]
MSWKSLVTCWMSSTCRSLRGRPPEELMDGFQGGNSRRAARCLTMLTEYCYSGRRLRRSQSSFSLIMRSSGESRNGASENTVDGQSNLMSLTACIKICRAACKLRPLGTPPF